MANTRFEDRPAGDVAVTGLNRYWDGKDWQAFARQIVQMRHGAQNVQPVPDRVKGDAGLEFFTTDGCLYQCYAPEEVFDVAKASSAVKAKATRDLRKLKSNEAIIAGIVGNLKFNRWIILCPFLDDKDVIRHIAAKVNEFECHKLSFALNDFIGLAHSLDDFASEVELLRRQSRGVPISLISPTSEEIYEAEGRLLEKSRKQIEAWISCRFA